MKSITAPEHPAMIGEILIKGHEQFCAGHDALFRCVLEKGDKALEMEPPTVFNRDFKDGWNTARKLIKALGVSDHVPFQLVPPQEG